MLDATLRYDVIGTGMMGIEHVKNLALLPGAEVVARPIELGGSV